MPTESHRFITRDTAISIYTVHIKYYSILTPQDYKIKEYWQCCKYLVRTQTIIQIWIEWQCYRQLNRTTLCGLETLSICKWKIQEQIVWIISRYKQKKDLFWNITAPLEYSLTIWNFSGNTYLWEMLSGILINSYYKKSQHNKFSSEL